MSVFYIEKLEISGLGKEDSTINFSKGVNIIYGPSNTGKTYIAKCIDFLFGSKDAPIDVSTGYDLIRLFIKTKRATVILSRKIGGNSIEVSSTDSEIESGKYYAKNSKYEKTIGSVWLLLMGISEKHDIISKVDFKKNSLTWRTFCHWFLLTETKIISERSALLPALPFADISVISSLIFLLTGNDFNEMDVLENKKTREVKINAIKNYINQDLSKLAERNQEIIERLNGNCNLDLSREITLMISEIEMHEKKVGKAINNNQNVLISLHEKNEVLSECNTLLSRYDELKSQYYADLKRLNFIVDGEVNLSNTSHSQCPFCDSAMSMKTNPNYLEAAKSDYKKTKLQILDLEKATSALLKERLSLEQSIDELLAEKEETEILIKNVLEPKISELKNKLEHYKVTVELQNEITVIKKWVASKADDIINVENEENQSMKFKPKEHLDSNFITKLTDEVENLLEYCHYENLSSVTFDKADMDIVINGKKKSHNGKGYNAFLNSVILIVFNRYLQRYGKYSPNLLILDSPILSLKENEDIKTSETMGDFLFENIIEYSEDIQTIIIENEIPKIDYKNANLIRFTKDVNNGRYGLLQGVTE